MRPLDDPSWHLQFQSDRYEGQGSYVNIGWYWARPTEITKQFFRRAQTRWVDKHEWDQGVVNLIRLEMIDEGLLDFPKSIVVSLVQYKATLLFDWEAIFIDTDLIDEMNKVGIIVHYTGIWAERKIFMAKHFGHWNNKTYYAESPLLLQPVNISGTSSEIFQKMVRAANIANLCGRTFMFPFVVNERLPDSTWRLEAPHWTSEIGDIMRVGPWVESTYLRNRRGHNSTELSEETILGPRDIIWNYASQPIVDACVTSKSELLKLDFA